MALIAETNGESQNIKNDMDELKLKTLKEKIVAMSKDANEKKAEL